MAPLKISNAVALVSMGICAQLKLIMTRTGYECLLEWGVKGKFQWAFLPGFYFVHYKVNLMLMIQDEDFHTAVC